MLATYDYHRVSDFFESIAPSFRYGVTRPILFLTVLYPSLSVILSAFFPTVNNALGIDGGAFIGLVLAFVVELVSGIIASHIRGEQFSSLKLSRFGLKVFIYLVLIAVPYHWYLNFDARHKVIMAVVFDWLHSFLIAQIVFENIISILENMAVICGNDKTAWINKIKNRLTTLWP